MTLDVITLGPLNADLLIVGQAPTDLDQLTQWVGPSDVTVTAAGSTGYTTLALAKLGLRTGVVSMLADDVLGDLVYQDLQRAKIDVKHVARQAGTLSGIGIYMLLFGSKKRPLTYRMPTHLPWPLPLTVADKDYLLSGRHVHCGGYLHFPFMWNDDLAEVFHAAQQRGIGTSLDPQVVLADYQGAWIDPLRVVLKYTDVLLLDAHEAMRLAPSGDLIASALILQQAGPNVVVIKNGVFGALVCVKASTFQVPAVPVPEAEIVDTVGAGDAFDAGFIAGLLTDWPIEKAAAFAVRAASSSLRGPGAVTSLASRAELEQMLDVD